LGTAAVPFLGKRSGIHIERNVAWADAYLHTEWHPNPGHYTPTSQTERTGQTTVR